MKWSEKMDDLLMQMREDPVGYVERARRDAGSRDAWWVRVWQKLRSGR